MAMGDANRSVEQAEIIVDLGNGADGGARAAAGGLLLDRDGWAQAFDRVNVGPLHLVQELAGVSGERLNVAALSLGINDVKGEARFTGTTQSGHDRQRVARDLDVNVFQVMLARAANRDPINH